MKKMGKDRGRQRKERSEEKKGTRNKKSYLKRQNQKTTYDKDLVHSVKKEKLHKKTVHTEKTPKRNKLTTPYAIRPSKRTPVHRHTPYTQPKLPPPHIIKEQRTPKIHN